jgi:hypothetical protein
VHRSGEGSDAAARAHSIAQGAYSGAQQKYARVSTEADLLGKFSDNGLGSRFAKTAACNRHGAVASCSRVERLPKTEGGFESTQ